MNRHPEDSYITEYVNGTIIGEPTYPYEFWRGNHKIASGFFVTDAEAMQWFQEMYQAEYKQGVEMRAFD